MPTPKLPNLPPGREEPQPRDKHLKLMTVVWGEPAPTTDGTDNMTREQVWWTLPRTLAEGDEPITCAVSKMLIPKQRAVNTRLGPVAPDIARKARLPQTEVEEDWLP